ncbi:type IX secretion system membrane protein PorP/SprF [Pontibacter sp. 172403-2]|uniref:PorP/SprF family type IX secretion system membrane protein n=1 Tax=Pontibacter rufus TaxID=2791028 RepID=UPI0018B00E32|nr:type IX secretion system membrane protein PorP/SprF [Pontibacter sp. 172403-2]MBF9253902.1 type IX secretion system membrane protein PorP/SprF [Pontibacter sp. 172403-2]
MRRILLGAILCLITAVAALAQQRPQYSQYVQNNYLTNPAVGGIESYTDFRLGYRTQWAGLEGAPTSFYATLHGSLGNNGIGSSNSSRGGFSKQNRYKRAVPHHGVGMLAMVDKAGLLRTSTLNLSYSYHLPLNRYLTLASGISSGITQFALNTQNAAVFDPGDPYLSGAVQNATKADLALGFWLYSPDFYVGVSGGQLLRNGSDFAQGGTISQPHLRQQPHFYGTAGLRLPLSSDLSVVPSVMVKATESAAPAIDFNLRALYLQRIWGGVSYRHHDAMAVMAGINVSTLLDIGYSYDLSTSSMNQVSAGSHEVVVGFKLNNRRKVICPTWVW